MKRFFLFILTLLILFPSVVHAQEKVAMLPIPPSEKPVNLFGQNHYYSVTLRGNGEAVVTLKVILSNTGTTPLTTVRLPLPEKSNPTDLVAYQVMQKPQCIRYLPQPFPYTKPQSTTDVIRDVCAEYQQPDYQYLYGSATYQRMESETKNNTIVLTLPTPIEPNKNGSYFVYYRTSGVTQRDIFGAYDYTFTSLKSEDKIRSLQVGIDTDADYLLRGTQGDVNYKGEVALAALPAVADSSRQGISNTQFDQFYNQIGSGRLVKQASELAANETYEVKGSYADSQAKLYGKEIALGTGIFLFLVIILIVAVKVILKKLSSGKKTDKPEEAVVHLKARNKLFLISLSISFISMLFVSLYTFAIYAVTQLFTTQMYYGYPTGYTENILILVVFAVSALVYLFFFFAPAVGMGIKKGMGWALVTFAATVVWAVLFLLLLFAVLLFFTPKNSNDYPRPFYSATSGFGGIAAPVVDLAAPAEAPEAITEMAAPTAETGEARTLQTPTTATTLEAKPAEPQTVQIQPLRQDDAVKVQ